jgi:hypothetical protein
MNAEVSGSAAPRVSWPWPAFGRPGFRRPQGFDVFDADGCHADRFAECVEDFQDRGLGARGRLDKRV